MSAKRRREFSYLSMETDDELAQRLGYSNAAERLKLQEDCARVKARIGEKYAIKSLDEEAEFWDKPRKMVERHVE